MLIKNDLICTLTSKTVYVYFKPENFRLEANCKHIDAIMAKYDSSRPR